MLLQLPTFSQQQKPNIKAFSEKCSRKQKFQNLESFPRATVQNLKIKCEYLSFGSVYQFDKYFYNCALPGIKISSDVR